MELFPLVTWSRCDNALADRCLVQWGHWLGGCNRPFGRQSFVLRLYDEPVAVGVSAATVNAVCGPYCRGQVVELARLCAHPLHRDMTRVALRLWRVTAAQWWLAAMNRNDLLVNRKWLWRVDAYVSYANAIRHKGDIYRFDGWRKIADVKGGGGGGTWSKKKSDPKSLWVYSLHDENAGTATPPLVVPREAR